MSKWHPHHALHRLLLAVPLVGLVIALTATASAFPIVTKLPSQVPLPPANVHALAVSVDEVDLFWSATTNQDVRGYAIFRNDTPLATLNAGILAYIDVSVLASTTYTYTIAIISPDDLLSPPSTPVVLKTPALPETPDLMPSSPPQALTATPQDASVLLDWYHASDDTDITAYQIRRDGLVMALVNSGTLSYFDTTIQPATTYTYTVEAIDTVGHHSMPSNLAEVTTLAFTANQPLAAPALLQTTVDEDDAIVLTWSAVEDSNLAGYAIYRNHTTLVQVISSTLTFSDTDVLPNTAYAYSVAALDAAGNHSAPSLSVMVVLPSEPPRFLALPRQ